MDWQQGKSILQCISTLYLNERLSDVYFTFPHEPDKTPLPAHKFLLASRSPEFEAMFYGNSPEVHPEVQIEDITWEIFRLFLKYLYTDELEIDRDIVTPLLHASEKYQVTTLSKKCATFLEAAVNVSNVCVIFEQASFFGLTALVLKALRLIEQNTEKVLKSKGFTSLSKASIGCILRSENLTAKEISVFRAAMKWAAAECERKGMVASGQNERHILGDLFFHIRIPLLTLDEFTKYVVDTGVLTEHEQLQLFKFFTCKTNNNRKDIPDFIDKPRKNGFIDTSSDVVSSITRTTNEVVSDVLAPEVGHPIDELQSPVPPLDLTPVTVTPLLLDIQSALGFAKDDQYMLITGDLVTDYKCINQETIAVFSNLPLKLTEVTMLHTIKCASCENVIDQVMFAVGDQKSPNHVVKHVMDDRGVFNLTFPLPARKWNKLNLKINNKCTLCGLNIRTAYPHLPQRLMDLPGIPVGEWTEPVKVSANGVSVTLKCFGRNMVKGLEFEN